MRNGMLNCHNIDELYDAFVSSHETQLKKLGIPEPKWRTLLVKLNNSIFDAGDFFIYCKDESEDENRESNESSSFHLKIFTKCSMEPEDEDNIFLIDHAWTYTLQNARSNLLENQNLLERMCSIMNQSFPADSLIETVDSVLQKMWQFNNSYVLENPNQAGSYFRCFFIMDEFGSRIGRSDAPTFAVVPFFFGGDKTMYSLLFPIVCVAEEEEVTYGFPAYNSDLPVEVRNAFKYPWTQCDLSDVEFTQCEPEEDYYSSFRHVEILPEAVEESASLVSKRKIVVYSDYPEVSEHLTNPKFVFTQEKEKADILWLAQRVFDYKSLYETRGEIVFISQFASEQVLTNKDLLAFVSRRAGSNLDMKTLKSKPSWLPTTYNLMSELPKFVSYFQNRERRDLDNTWVCKPYNLARGIDIYLTNNLNQIVRLAETRPMVACKYVTDPVLFPRENIGLVKTDFRFLVLLKNAHNLELFLYDRFWIRFANKPFSLDNFEDYETHFTVMNYSNYSLQQMFCHDFIQQFESFYESYKWENVMVKLRQMIRELFSAAVQKKPPAGLGRYPGFRAVYGLDVMFEWDRHLEEPEINPVLLEVNWMPDCKRACQYYPDFYDDIFGVLFLDQMEGKHVVRL